ncbi:type IV secretion system DNA-binding domain-containing protein [Aliarcobacter butzleri]|uniref:type IV secretory system conjugative DNA transfer family protein n=1 Tax=Aliarcobacter butzleri TaxID=28197 RepID=UPI0021B46F1F|nr:type IV secretory system conjugative DNA transfer family protein [Aliarcobacter butzleri]MCT7583149.1 type IV secretion system DNA-binding domain-containing protein [Aliarcobacter butzleri]
MTRNIYNKYSGMAVKRLLEKGILILRYADKDEYVFYDKILNLLVKGSKTTVETEISRELGICCKIVEDAYKAHKKNNYNSNFIYYEMFNIPLIIQKGFFSSEDKFIKNKDDKTYIENINVLTLYMKPIADDSLDKYSNLDSKTLKFLNTITKSDKSQNIAMFLSKMICEPFETEGIILIGDKNVSLIFQKNILNPIYGTNVCFLTEENLIHSNMNDLLENYNIFYVNFIPQSEEGKNKLKELTYKISSNQRLNTNYHNEQYYSGYIIFALETPDDFLKNFTSFYQVYFLNDLPKILELMSLKNDLELHKSISSSLKQFSCELQYLHKNKDSMYQAEDDKSELLEILKDTGFNSLQNNNSFDMLTIQNLHNVIPHEERYKHTYITGQSGSGKTEIMKTLCLSDYKKNDSSIIIVEPHGDPSIQIAKNIEDKNRLVYIDVILNNEKTPTINPFDIEDKNESNIKQTAKMILSILKDINDDDKFSGAMSDVLENCIPVLLRKGNSSFIELYRFMNDKRNKDLIELGKKSINDLESEYFEDKFCDSSLSTTKEAVARRLRKLINDELFSNLMNGKSTINLEQLMNTKGKIIIFRILKSNMLHSYKFYARFIIGIIQIFALKRANLEEKDRVHTHLYIDEFHNFITPSIEEILTESRKYKLFLTLAHQSVSQLKDSGLEDIILSNTNVKIIGRNSNKTLDALNKNLNEKLTNVENLDVGEFYIKAGNKPAIKIKNSDEHIGDTNSISDEKWSEIKEYQLQNFYRNIKQEDALNLNQDELSEMIELFKADISSKNLTESSCLYKIQKEDPKRFDEIKSDFEYVDKKGVKKPRIRKQELNEVFSLAFGIKNFLDNRKFIPLLKNENDTNCIFNKDFNDSRSGNYTYDGKVKTEQYYYINGNN